MTSLINGISWFSKKPNSTDVAPIMNTYSYDGHGNIKSLIRINGAGGELGNYTYNYQTNSNKLSSVTGYATYSYDAVGQLASQTKGNAGMYLDYDVSGKVTKIYSDAAKQTIILSFVYDDDGNRVMKKDHRTGAVTWYSYDGSGTLTAVFEQHGTGAVQLKEQPVYGSDRLGTFYRLGSNYQYTITDHVGNTRVVINRNKTASGGADIVYYADYYPFGMEARSGGIENRYGYQGLYAEKDKETGWNNFELRNYDAVIGRWLTTDPYGQYHSPYVGMGNNPVSGFDVNGGWSKGDDPPLKPVYGNGYDNRLDEVLVTKGFIGNPPPSISVPRTVPSIPRIAPYSPPSSGSIFMEAYILLKLFTSGPNQPYTIGYENKKRKLSNTELINNVKTSPAYQNENKDVDGSYTITWGKGTKYHGKGPMKRMIESAIQRTIELKMMKSPAENLVIVKMEWEPSVSSREAFKAEYRRLQTDAVPSLIPEGYRNPINLNRIQSPGKAFIEQDGF